MSTYYEFSPSTHLLVTDEDAGDFLQSQFTNQLRPFEEGQYAYGLWLNVKGKVLGDSAVLCSGEAHFRLISECSQADAIVEHMQRHIIADDVVIESATPAFGFSFCGDCLSSLDLLLPEAGQFCADELGVTYPARYLPAPAYNRVCFSEAAAAAFRQQLAAAGFAELSVSERGVSRIEAALPLVPQEVGMGDLPGEGALASDAVSFTKGCYLGQEVVARMHNVGRPQRGLFVVAAEGVVPDCPLTLYNAEAKKVGELRSAYRSGSAWLGVAMLKNRYVKTGDVLVADALEINVKKQLRDRVAP